LAKLYLYLTGKKSWHGALGDHAYSDGDVAVQFRESVRRKHVFLMQPTSRPAQNSHLGDALATEMGQRSELNVAQLMREKYGSDAVLVGFTTHHGAVTAASDWGGAGPA
jgi:hypothetical protein